MMNPADPMAELYELCELALQAAEYRPLTPVEINALRFAAAIPEQNENVSSGEKAAA
jgi:hypothetical protein